MNPIKHVAIIMDGNGRWGLKKKNSRNFGHKAGLVTVEKIIKVSIKKKIKYLTLYAFSTENWKRPKKEINFLFGLLHDFLKKKTNELNENGIKFKVIGNRHLFSKKLSKILSSAEKITKNNKILHINLALNYGSKSEIINSIRLITKKKIPINQLNISKNLYTKDSPDPDLLIRTGKTNRLSNFLLWQIAYTEIYFTKVYWPSFDEDALMHAIQEYQARERRFGKISEQI